MQIKDLMLGNYMPYARMTIIARAIPAIDGLKPVQRRLLYTMKQLGLLNGDKVKSQKINGATMSIHPHGDSSIYETMVLLTQNYEGINVPYVEGKGSFGKKYSRDLKYSAPRYTEAKLAPICREMFDGIDEDAVDFVDNFDGSTKEPTLLPVKFPNILVNSNDGVAVGMSSNIPSFSLINVCNATKGVLDGTITTPEQLAEVLGAPEFTTGGFIHASKESLTKLCATGKGSFKISGAVEVYSDKIVITQVPYTTTAEDIMDAIDAGQKDKQNKRFKGIKDVKDEIGLDGLRIILELKSGYNPREVLQEVCRYTDLRTSISYKTRVIINNRCVEVGLIELINNWIEFREQSIIRINKHRLDKNSKDAHLLETWEKIIKDIAGAVALISKNTDEKAKEALKSAYGLDDIQVEYLLDMKIRSITTDKAQASIDKLAKLRSDIDYNNKVINNRTERVNIITSDLNDVISKYGKDKLTNIVDEIKEEDEKPAAVKISDEVVAVVLTRDGYLRRLTSIKDFGSKFVAKNGDPEIARWSIKNNEHLLVFDKYGSVHKILVDDIDSSRRDVMTDTLHGMAGLEKKDDVIWADACGDYTKYFNLIYPNGSGVRVHYSRALGKSGAGNRDTYKSIYEPVLKGYFVTTEDKFFLITAKNKAAYCDITKLGLISTRTSFKVARLSGGGDYFCKLQPANKVPNIGLINIEKYYKQYTVSIGDDILWVDSAQIAATEKMLHDKLEEYKRNEEAINADSNKDNE